MCARVRVCVYLIRGFAFVGACFECFGLEIRRRDYCPAYLWQIERSEVVMELELAGLDFVLVLCCVVCLV